MVSAAKWAGIDAQASQGGAGLRWRPQSVKRFEALTEPTGETSCTLDFPAEQAEYIQRVAQQTVLENLTLLNIKR